MCFKMLQKYFLTTNSIIKNKCLNNVFNVGRYLNVDTTD